MSRLGSHIEAHATSRIGWLRAAVMGANDGIVSTASLIIGVASASASTNGVLGALGARTGGAPILPSVLRVVFWGALAMAITAGVGKLFGVAVG